MSTSTLPRSKRAGLLAAALLLATTGSAHAALLSWGAPTSISADSDVSINGTLVGARNFAGPDATVNGVSFGAWELGSATIVKTACPALPSDGVYTSGNFTLTYALSNCGGDVIGERDTSSALAPFSALSAGYRALLGTAGSRGDKTIALDLAGLIPGQTYEIQVWVSDSDDFDPPGFTFPLTIDGIVDLDPNTSLDGGGLGQYVVGTFTADSSSQRIEFFGGEVGIFNAFQLRAIASLPEPGTLALLGVVLAGVAFATRRQRRAQA